MDGSAGWHAARALRLFRRHRQQLWLAPLPEPSRQSMAWHTEAAQPKATTVVGSLQRSSARQPSAAAPARSHLARASDLKREYSSEEPDGPESCKSGSAGEAAGDRRLYPTTARPRMVRTEQLRPWAPALALNRLSSTRLYQPKASCSRQRSTGNLRRWRPRLTSSPASPATFKTHHFLPESDKIDIRCCPPRNRRFCSRTEVPVSISFRFLHRRPLSCREIPANCWAAERSISHVATRKPCSSRNVAGGHCGYGMPPARCT